MIGSIKSWRAATGLVAVSREILLFLKKKKQKDLYPLGLPGRVHSSAAKREVIQKKFFGSFFSKKNIVPLFSPPGTARDAMTGRR